MSLILVATGWFLSYDEVDARRPAWGAVHRLSGTRRITGRGPEPGVCSPTFCQTLLTATFSAEKRPHSAENVAVNPQRSGGSLRLDRSGLMPGGSFMPGGSCSVEGSKPAGIPPGRPPPGSRGIPAGRAGPRDLPFLPFLPPFLVARRI